MAWITKEKRLAIYLRDNFSCGYCGANLKDADPSYITLDHLIPRCKDGKNDTTNLVTACRPCNCTLKHMQSWTEFADEVTVAKIDIQRQEPLNLRLAKALIEGVTEETL